MKSNYFSRILQLNEYLIEAIKNIIASKQLGSAHFIYKIRFLSDKTHTQHSSPFLLMHI